MAKFTTTKGKSVLHEHPFPELSATQIALARNFVNNISPTSTEIKPPTNKFNCHGFALARSHGWFGEPDLFLADDFNGASMEDPEVGDVVVYLLRSLITHTARVTAVNAHKITEVQSKWGEAAAITHDVETVPELYGKPVLLLKRRIPFAPPDEVLIGVEDDIPPEEQPLNPFPPVESDRIPDRVRFNLMLASSPEVKQRIIDSLSSHDLLGSAAFSHIDTFKEGAAREEIYEALAQLSSDKVRVMLMLASVDDVMTRIIESLPEVRTIAAMGPEAGMAVLELFARDEPQ